MSRIQSTYTECVGVRVKRVTEPAEADDGARVLVDRYWPRGVRKVDAALDCWARDVAPSADLVSWFGHRPERWEGFRARYREELSRPERRDAVDRLRAAAAADTLTLLFGSREREQNNAMVLAEMLRE